MNAEQHLRLMAGPFRIELTQEEIVEDLCWPGPPPGRWLDHPREREHDRVTARSESRSAA